jgi:hypothetical protein
MFGLRPGKNRAVLAMPVSRDFTLESLQASDRLLALQMFVGASRARSACV